MHTPIIIIQNNDIIVISERKYKDTPTVYVKDATQSEISL